MTRRPSVGHDRRAPDRPGCPASHAVLPFREPPLMNPSGGDPHPANAVLREAGAAVPVTLPSGIEGYAVTRHEALRDFLCHPDVAKDARHFAALQRGEVPEGWPLRTFATVPGMTTADGRDHRRLRAPVARVFTPRRIAALRPRVRELTDRLLDDLAAAAERGEAGEGVADLRRHLALPLPINVICELLGVPDRHRERLHALSHQIVSTDLTPERVTAANREMREVLARVVAERRRDRGDDLTSALLSLHEAGDGRLSEAELTGTLLLLVVAGHETTLNLITNAVRALCAHRDQLRLLLDGTVPWERAVEETLRWDSPVSHFPFRYPVRDVEVGGTTIPAGAPVLASYSAAGRDPRTHGEDADRFDLTRPAHSRHLSFGHGPHYCLGAPLARLEATVALERLFTRFPRLQQAVPDHDLPRRRSFVSNSTQTLPVRLHPPR